MNKRSGITKWMKKKGMEIIYYYLLLSTIIASLTNAFSSHYQLKLPDSWLIELTTSHTSLSKEIIVIIFYWLFLPHVFYAFLHLQTVPPRFDFAFWHLEIDICKTYSTCFKKKGAKIKLGKYYPCSKVQLINDQLMICWLTWCKQYSKVVKNCSTIQQRQGIHLGTQNKKKCCTNRILICL